MNQSNISLRSTLAKPSLTEDVPKAHTLQQQARAQKEDKPTYEGEALLCAIWPLLISRVVNKFVFASLFLCCDTDMHKGHHI